MRIAASTPTDYASTLLAVVTDIHAPGVPDPHTTWAFVVREVGRHSRLGAALQWCVVGVTKLGRDYLAISWPPSVIDPKAPYSTAIRKAAALCRKRAQAAAQASTPQADK